MSDENRIDVIGLGELLWDCFPTGKQPGGAPANVAFHAQQLGLSARVATRVGEDALGDELCEFLSRQRLRTYLVQRDPRHGTGTVTVELQPNGTTNYTFLENSAWDFLEADEQWLAAMHSARAVCFGTLAQRGEQSRQAIRRCLEATSETCLRVYDVNLRPPFFAKDWIIASLELATIVKMNDDEVHVLSTMLAAPYSATIPFAWWLRKTFDLELVCITRGGDGALAVTEHETCEVPGLPVTIADTVGAGDAFTAALIWSRLTRRPLAEGLRIANRLGGLVASRTGAMPDLRAEIAATIRGTSVSPAEDSSH